MLQQLIRHRREAILDAWFGRIVDGYPAQTARFLRATGDAFDNPVGAALREGLGSLLDLAIEDGDVTAARAAVDRIVRIRAVQDMPPSVAVAFVADLKRVVREQVSDPVPETERDWLDRCVDSLLLMAFDVYAECRDDVCRVQVEAIRNRSVKVMERFNAWQERRADQADPTVRPQEGGRS
jgi:hypothetical protein